MKLTLKRTYKCNDYTIGHLYVDGVYLCDTIEDCDRGLDQNMTSSQIRKIKKKSVTAIPTGTYGITLNVVSPKYSKKKWFNDFCMGRMPRLLNVPGFDGILIHTGNTAKDSDGCLLVGYNKIKGQVINSTEAFVKLYTILKQASERHEGIYIEIVRTYQTRH